MKNKCSNAILFIVVILPFTLLSYQNCSQLQSTDIETLSSRINLKESEPLLLSGLDKTSYKAGNNCSSVDDMTFYNPEYNLCAQATDTCEANYLQENGYYLASNNNCLAALSEEEMALDSFSSQTPEELGYVVNNDLMCSQVVETYVNLFSRVCSFSTDGCQAKHLRENKFIKDSYNLCSYEN